MLALTLITRLGSDKDARLILVGAGTREHMEVARASAN